MQELAVCILQDLTVNGPRRAQSLHLEVVRASSGGKTVKIADPFDDGTEIDQSFLDEIDSVIFKFKYQSVASPDVSFSSDQDHVAPYLPATDDGGFVTPNRSVTRSLRKEIKV